MSTASLRWRLPRAEGQAKEGAVVNAVAVARHNRRCSEERKAAR